MRNYNDVVKEYKGGDFSISDSKITSLIGCPDYITGDFACSYNELYSLMGGPQKVDGYYRCVNNNLTDLTGCASHIGGMFACYENDITSLVGIHKIIKSCKSIQFNDNNIKQGGIGLLLIENLTKISSTASEPFQIIKSYLGTGTKGMMECSKELKANGWAEYAKL